MTRRKYRNRIKFLQESAQKELEEYQSLNHETYFNVTSWRNQNIRYFTAEYKYLEDIGRYASRYRDLLQEVKDILYKLYEVQVEFKQKQLSFINR